MALRKVLDKFRTKSESKNEPDDASYSSKSSSHSHDSGGEAKKKMKKVRSIRVAPKKTVLFQPAAKETEREPNFMKVTTSYATKKETTQVTVTSSASTVKTKNTTTYTATKAVVKSSGKSSPLKQGNKTAMSSSESSNSVEEEEEDKHECTYPYCSLHGHKHGAALKRLLTMKMQNSMKQRSYSSAEKKGGNEIEIVENIVNELFIELQTKLQKQGIQIEEVENSSEYSGDKNSELSEEEIQVINQFLEYIDKEYRVEEEVQSKPLGINEQMELNSLSLVSEKDFSESTKDSIFSGSKVKRSRSRRQSFRNRGYVKELTSKPPRLLELKPEPEVEQVNLRHQEADERKAAEEWMVDFALRKTLGRLTSVRRKKVPMLVAAFETVLPQKV